MADPSLFKRLQYAKEVLVQMMGGNTGQEPNFDEPQIDETNEEEYYKSNVQAIMSPQALRGSSS